MNTSFNRQLAEVEAPTRAPRTWLLRVGWHRAGALSYDDRPAEALPDGPHDQPELIVRLSVGIHPRAEEAN
jgi:hypothetical protein